MPVGRVDRCEDRGGHGCGTAKGVMADEPLRDRDACSGVGRVTSMLLQMSTIKSQC
jgi:hypothetical protein